MTKNRKKVPNCATSRPDKKQVKIIDQPTDNKPLWRFSTVDKYGPFPWPKGSPVELHIVEKLHDFDSMYWEEIKGKQHHTLSPSSLSREAIERLKEIELDDEIEHLFSFHLQGRQRIIAINHANVAKLLWYDPDHGVAPSTKKHT